MPASLARWGVDLQHGVERLPWQHVRHRVMERRVRIAPHASRHRSRAGAGEFESATQKGLYGA
jgi:hypothetical protein